MKRGFLALAVSGVVFGLGAGPAMADGGFAGQASQQVAGNQQYAEADANSTQYQPSNSNISVRVLSPGDDGNVTQANNSYADADAANENATSQTVDQSQSGAGQAVVQEALQRAGNQQAAVSNAESTQVQPQNRNISVRVLSPGDNGDVSQENDSEASSRAHNTNALDQSAAQDQGGSCCAKRGGSGAGVQAAGQEALNRQYADADAESVQVKPSNSNISARVLSPGDDGDVDQSNSSSADADAYNDNETGQSIAQDQDGSGCGCHGGEQVQAAGQEAYSKQWADADAESVQVKPSNRNISARVLSPGDGGDVDQSNSSSADADAYNDNETDQSIAQDQSGPGCGCYGGAQVQAAGQAAYNAQKADADARSKQFHPENHALSFRFWSWGGSGYLSQANDSSASSRAANRNDLDQALAQAQGG